MEHDSVPREKREDISEIMDYSSYDLRTTIRLVVLSGESRRVDVIKGSRQGTIFIKDGEIHSAVANDLKGDEAFFEMLSWIKAEHSDAHQRDQPEGNMRVSTSVLLDLLAKETGGS